MRIVLTGGGTSGHVTPFEPIVSALRAHFLAEKDILPARLDPGELIIYFLGVTNKETHQLLTSYDVAVTHIPSGKLRRYFSWRNFVDIFFRLPYGIALAFWHLWRIMPEVVISKGGYGSLPVVIAAVFYRIPILLHESDVIPGLTNRLVTRYAAAIAVGWPTVVDHLGQWKYKTIVTGTPSRTIHYEISTKEARRKFGISEMEPVLLITGGSQGAQQINEALLQVLPQLIADMTIIHVTGQENFTTVDTIAKEILASSSRKACYKSFAFLSDKMVFALIAADVVVTRAGATSLAELTALRKPMLIIPLASAASDHQRHNAQAYEAAGAALVLEPNNLGAHLLEQNIRRLMTDQTLRAALQSNLKKMDYPQAAHHIAQIAFTLATGLAPVKKQA